MILLKIEHLLNEVDELDLPKLSYPYVYSDRTMMKLFLYALVHHIHGRPCIAILKSDLTS